VLKISQAHNPLPKLTRRFTETSVSPIHHSQSKTTKLRTGPHTLLCKVLPTAQYQVPACTNTASMNVNVVIVQKETHMEENSNLTTAKDDMAKMGAMRSMITLIVWMAIIGSLIT
jgi:hypothetical protein